MWWNSLGREEHEWMILCIADCVSFVSVLFTLNACCVSFVCVLFVLNLPVSLFITMLIRD